jgi:hypothetical protein
MFVATTILIVALAAPTMAGAAAAPAVGLTPVVAVTTTPATAKSKAAEALKLRITEVLRLRALSFNATTSGLSKRIASVSAIATRIQKAGGNVGVARKHIAASKRHLVKASALERQTVASFNAVVSASDRKAAFAAARKKGRQATAQLKLAQADISRATAELRRVIKKLETR